LFAAAILALADEQVAARLAAYREQQRSCTGASAIIVMAG